MPQAHGQARGAGQRWALVVAGAISLALAVTGCGGDGVGDDPATATPSPATPRSTGEASGRVLRVPSSYRTIQAAVDATRPGDLVLIAPGTYEETVEVSDEHPEVVIRGEDRNAVILDGRHERPNGIVIEAAGVAVENLTVRNYQVNGVLWSTDTTYAEQGRYTQGWRGSYLTAYHNGLYGVYAFGVQHGRFDHVYASGHPDSGIYVGRCRPCDALVTHSVTERNHVGLEFTNASGVTVRDNVTRRNRVGIQVNSLDKERDAPQDGMTIERNDVADNQERDAPRASDGFGAGIVINGGRGTVVRANRVTDHDAAGIVVLDSPDYTAERNRVERNRLRGNRVDLALQAPGGRSAENCFLGNRPRRTLPDALERVTECGASQPIESEQLPGLPAPPQVDYRTVPAPRKQPSMPDAKSAPAEPASGRPERS